MNFKRNLIFLIYILLFKNVIDLDCTGDEGPELTKCKYAGPNPNQPDECECQACNRGGILIQQNVASMRLSCDDRSDSTKYNQVNLANCKEINFNNPSECMNCEFGYMKSDDSNNICKKVRVVENCSKYEYDSTTNKFECKACALGYGGQWDNDKKKFPLFEDACDPKCFKGKLMDYDTENCRAKPTGLTEKCFVVEEVTDNKFECRACFPEYHLDEQNFCKPCQIEHCAFCDHGGDNCDQCLLGYYFDSRNKKCLPCPSGCPYCSNSKECDGQCQEGFEFKSGTCLKKRSASSNISLHFSLLFILISVIFG